MLVFAYRIKVRTLCVSGIYMNTLFCRRWTLFRIYPIAVRSILVFSCPECDEDGRRSLGSPENG